MSFLGDLTGNISWMESNCSLEGGLKYHLFVTTPPPMPSLQRRAQPAPYLAMSIRLCREVGTQVFSPWTKTTPRSI